MAILKSSSGNTFDTNTQTGVNAQGQGFNAPTPAVDIGVQTNTTPKPITSGQLQPQGSLTLGQPKTVPTPTAPTLTPSEAYLQAQQTKSDTATSDYEKLLEQFGLKSQVQSQLQDQYGASTSFDSYTDLSNKLVDKQRALELRKRDLLSSGGFESQAQALNAYRAEESKSLQEQADIAILGNASLNKYNAAIQNAKDKVDLEFAPLEAQLAYKKDVMEANKDVLTKAEYLKVQSMYNTQEAKLAEERKQKQASMDMIIKAISQGASQSIQSKSLELYNKGSDQTEIASALGVYAGDYLDTKYKNAQISKIYQDIADAKIVSSEPTIKTTEGEKASASFANRLDFSNKILDKFENTMKDMTWAQFKLIESNSSLANKLLSSDQQQAGQAMRNFITAKLRKESGAAISPTEFDEARKQYFPQYGDSDAVLQQKKEGRLLAFEGEKNSAGKAYIPLKDEVLQSAGVSDNPFKQSLLGGNSAFNQSTGQWNVPIK